MRLGVDAWRLQGPQTGIHRYLSNILRHWSDGSQGTFDEITLYASSPLDRNATPLPESLTVKVLNSGLPMRVWQNVRLGPSARDDVLFFPSHSRPFVAHGRTVVTTHDAVSRIHPDLFGRLASVYNALYSWSARHATLVIADSEAGAHDIARCYSIPLERVRTVDLAPSEVFKPVREREAVAAAVERHVGFSTPFFVFVGKVSGRRSVPTLLRAFAEFKQRTAHPHHLVLVGPTPDHAELDRLIGELAIEKYVQRPGFVPDDDLNLLLNAADAFVMPSVYETVSLPVLEAQAAGTPVICIDTAGMREVTGGAAVTVRELQPALLLEAMVSLAEDEGRRSELSERGIANARRFSWQRCSAETMAVLEEAAQL